ncbi:hypothetical protein Scep_006819 [Stephania cephalantha]|uniref:Uncharacterized protein n=1 Tax=Stephania cephalantha TaxID=152367 RepID=A0AAP0K8V1_9MAGN
MSHLDPSHLNPSNDQCETSNTTLDGDKEHVEFVDENIVNNDDNVDIVDNEEDNVEIVANVDIGDDNKIAMIVSIVLMELKQLIF